MASDYQKISQYNEKQLGADRASRMSQVAMYADTAHFVYEILQNADDAGATEICFTVNAEQLVIEHNGAQFTEDNVEAISYFGKGKTDITKIGHFGLGFKSVFAYTASPRIHSGEESFEITALYSVANAPFPSDLKRKRTRFVLPFDHCIKKPDYIERRKLKSAKNAYKEIVDKLANLGGETLLFTKSLMEIHWTTQEEEGHYLREDIPVYGGREIYIMTGDSEDRYYLIFDRTIFWPDEDGEDVEHRPVQIAFGLDKRLQEGGAIEGIEDARLFVFFPTDKETHTGLILQGPYRTTPARDNVPANDDFNQHLVKESAALLKASLANIKELGLLNLDTLATLPINHEEFKEGTFFHPLYVEVRDALANQTLLPTASRGFTSGLQAKLARGAELTKVFGPSQLEQLFGSPGLKWLEPELTQNNYTELHRFLVGKKKSQHAYFEKAEWLTPPLAPDIEVAAEQIAKRINTEFMSQQTDQWVLRFYEYLSGPSGHWNFVDRPIIRLEGDKHVAPMGKNDIPNAFLPADDEDDTVYGLPIVKRSLLQREEIRNFLKDDIGLTQPDLADLVIKKILPKYSQEGKTIDTETCLRDFRKIRQALQTDSVEKKNCLLSVLSNASIVLTVQLLDESKIWRSKPNEAYCDSKEMKEFFHGATEKYFLAPDKYDDEDIRLLLELGVADSPRATKRGPNGDGYVKICSFHGWHKRGRDGFDPDWKMDGVENIVKAKTPIQSRLLWKYLLPHAACIQGIVEKSSRQTFENAQHVREISDLGKLLINFAWLPDKQGYFHKPKDLGLGDLPDGFEKVSVRAKELAEKLGMLKSEEQQALTVLTKGDLRKRRIAEYLLNANDDMLDKFDKLIPKEKKLTEFKTFKEGLSAVHRQQRQPQEDIPAPTSVRNPGRYQPSLDEEIKVLITEAQHRPQIIRFGLVRDSSVNDNAREFLYQQYQGKCQVSGQTFAKANGKNYFEAVTLVSRLDAEHLNHPGNMLCLSADTAAKFMHAGFDWLEDIETKIQQFKAEKNGGTEQHRKIRIRLAGKEETITWIEQHFMRMISLWNNA